MSNEISAGGDWAIIPTTQNSNSQGSSKPTETVTIDTTAVVSIFSNGDSTTVQNSAQTDTASANTNSRSSGTQGSRTNGSSGSSSSSGRTQNSGSRAQSTNQSGQTSSSSTTTKSTPDYSNMSRFHTSIPGFNGLNTNGFETPDLKTKTNVDIHIKGDDTQAVSVKERDDGSTVVYFTGSEMYAIIPPGQPKEPKPMIVYDPKTNTMAFSNIKGDGFEVKQLNPNSKAHKDKYPKDAKTGANILLNNCHAKHVDTAELKKGQKGLTQTVVFQNTVVDEFDTLGDNYITIGKTVINNADNHKEKADGKNYTYWASDGKGTVNRDESHETSNGNGQSGYTLNQGYRWIRGSENDPSLSKADGVTDKKVQVSVGDKKIINANYSGAYLCRQFNGVDIYFKGTDKKSDYAKKIINSHNGDTSFIDFNGTRVTFPQQDASSKAKIYYDADTGTLTFEGIKDLEVNYSEAEAKKDKVSLLQDKKDRTSRGTETVAKVYIKDCQCKNVNFMETNSTNNNAKFELESTEFQDILVLENSTVDNLYTNNDIVVKDDKSKIGYYAGDRTQIAGSGSDDLINNNHIEDVKNQFRTRASLDITGKEGFPDIKSDNFFLKGSNKGASVFVQGDDSKVEVSDSSVLRKTESGETKRISATMVSIKNTEIKFPAQSNERGEPKVYYDESTDAIILENIKDAQVVSYRGAKTKIYLKNSTCTRLDTQEHIVSEKKDSNNKVIEQTYILSSSKAADRERDLIYIDGNSSVQELLTNTDDVHIENGASVVSYAGVDTNISGSQNLEDINAFSEKYINERKDYDNIKLHLNKYLTERLEQYKHIIRNK